MHNMRTDISHEICDLEVAQHPDHDVLEMQTNSALQIVTDTGKKWAAIVQVPKHEEKRKIWS